MKVLMVNGSSKPNGCTATALQEIAKVLREEGIDSEIVCLGGGPLRDCIGCLGCTKLDGQCAFNDDCINEILEIEACRQCPWIAIEFSIGFD